MEFSPAMRTKARGTAALKPSPVSPAESHGQAPVSLSCLFFLSPVRLSLTPYFPRSRSVPLSVFSPICLSPLSWSISVSPPPFVSVCSVSCLSSHWCPSLTIPAHLALLRCRMFFASLPTVTADSQSCVTFCVLLIITRPPCGLC